jgi:rod shape-determining protein MreD
LSPIRGLNPWLWIGAPMLQAMVATLLFALPIRVFGLQAPEPVFAMAPAFAWAAIRPSVIAPFAVLILGLFLDYLWGGPRGLWSLSLLLTYGLALSGRSMLAGQGRITLFVWYAALTALSFFMAWLITAMTAGGAPNLIGVGLQYLATIALYPFAQALIDLFEDADVRFR